MSFINKLENTFTGGTEHANSVTPPKSPQAEIRLRSIASVVSRIRSDQQEEQSPGMHLSQGVTSDHYRGDSVVSIEEAAKTEHRLKKILDDDVDAENRGLFPLKKGIPPCKRRDHNT